MGIGTSKGAFYEDQFHYAQSQWDPKYDDNVVSPNKMQTDKQLDKTELDPSTGMGIEIGYKTESKELPDFTNQYGTPDQYKIWPERLVDSAIDAFKLPGDAWQGKVDPMSEEGRRRAFDLAGLMITGPAPIASKIADGTLGSFAGVRSLKNMPAELKGAKLSDLGHAQVLEANGIHPDDIYTTTGFFKGADGKWRYEIGDKDATFKGISEDGAKLGDVLDHPELYNHYPQFKDMDVYHDPTLSGAHYDPNTQSIVLGGKSYKNLLGEDTVAASDKSTLMHEVQHAIQHEEGFASGGTPSKAGNVIDTNPATYKLKFQDDYREWKNKADPIMDKIYDKFEKAGKDRSVLTTKEQDFVARYQRMNETYQRYRREGDIQASQNYFKLAGETEARNVQNRLDLPETQRRNTPPRWTQDIPDEQQIVKNEAAMATPYGAFTLEELNQMR